MSFENAIWKSFSLLKVMSSLLFRKMENFIFKLEVKSNQYFDAKLDEESEFDNIEAKKDIT